MDSRPTFYERTAGIRGSFHGGLAPRLPYAGRQAQFCGAARRRSSAVSRRLTGRCGRRTRGLPPAAQTGFSEHRSRAAYWSGALRMTGLDAAIGVIRGHKERAACAGIERDPASTPGASPPRPGRRPHRQSSSLPGGGRSRSHTAGWQTCCPRGRMAANRDIEKCVTHRLFPALHHRGIRTTDHLGCLSRRRGPRGCRLNPPAPQPLESLRFERTSSWTRTR